MELPDFIYVGQRDILFGPEQEIYASLSPIPNGKKYKMFPYKMHKFPTSFQATDAVIIHREGGKMLLGKKPNQPKWRFLGGFVDPKDPTLEAACRRECYEEGGKNLELTDPEYLFSFKVDDPRYTDESQDRIMSAVMLRYFLYGFPTAGDDIAQVKWFTKDYVRRNYRTMIMPEHFPIVEGLIKRGLL